MDDRKSILPHTFKGVCFCPDSCEYPCGNRYGLKDHEPDRRCHDHGCREAVRAYGVNAAASVIERGCTGRRSAMPTDTNRESQLPSCPTCGSDEHIGFDPGPQLWHHEEDRYTDAGDQLREEIEQAVRKIVGPLYDAHADAMHVQSLAVEAAASACYAEWRGRQDEPDGN